MLTLITKRNTILVLYKEICPSICDLIKVKLEVLPKNYKAFLKGMKPTSRWFPLF